MNTFTSLSIQQHKKNMSIMKKLLTVIALFFLCLVVSVPGYAQKTINGIIKRGELRVGMTGNQPPYNMKAKSGAVIGFEVDLAEVLATSMGVELNIVEMPFSQLVPSLEDGKIDMIMSGFNVTPERNMKFLFVGPYSVSGKSIVTNSRVLAGISSAEAINDKKYRIAALKGSTSQKFVETFLPNVELVPVEKYEVAIEEVANDSVDALVADYATCLVSVLKNPNRGLVTLDAPLTIDPVSIAINPTDPLFQNYLNNYLSSLELGGMLQLLEVSWFENGTWLNQIE
jgi:polar amino acid transport system substrate-binding protein